MPTSEPINETACAMAVQSGQNAVHVHVVMLALNFTSLLLYGMIGLDRKVRRMASLISPSLRALGFAAVIFFSFSALCSFLFSLFFLLRTHRAAHNCALIWNGLFCFLIRAPPFVLFFTLNLLQFAIFVERCRAVCGRATPCAKGTRFGGGLAAMAAILPYFLLMYLFYDVDIRTPRHYCHLALMTPASERKPLAQYTTSMMFLSMFTAVADAVLFVINSKQLKMKLHHHQDYSLTKAFQLRETQITMRVVLPFALAHSLVFIGYCSVAFFYRFAFVKEAFLWAGMSEESWMESLNVLKSVYLLSVPMSVYRYCFRRPDADTPMQEMVVEQRRSGEVDGYFEKFAADMDREYELRKGRQGGCKTM